MFHHLSKPSIKSPKRKLSYPLGIHPSTHTMIKENLVPILSTLLSQIFFYSSLNSQKQRGAKFTLFYLFLPMNLSCEVDTTTPWTQGEATEPKNKQFFILFFDFGKKH